MAITFKNNCFSLQTQNSTYQMKIGQYGYLMHQYYGRKISEDVNYSVVSFDRGFSGNPSDAGRDRKFSLDQLPQEFPCYGNGDYRIPACNLEDEKGIFGCDFRYVEHRINKGKYGLKDLPAVYADEEEADTLEIDLLDARTGVKVTLLFGVLEALDVITRSVKVTNQGDAPIRLNRIMSASVDFVTGKYELVHFHGRHDMERVMERIPVMHGTYKIGSGRGTSSHQHNPFVILTEAETTEDAGNCYGLSFLYSGNFSCETEKDQYDQTRILMGISPEMFAYPLNPGDAFTAPEVAMSFSGKGLTALSQNFHSLIRHHVCRGAFKLAKRPVLINNWEATYFDFTGDKIVEIARQAADLGVEMLVLDDGWFGVRNDDNSGLGDWFVNEEKLGQTLRDVVTRVKDLGMKFGLWIEPEMVSEDSDLYRKHPDWAFQVPGRKPVRGRNQLVLDFSRPEVVEGIYEQLILVMDELDLDYIKMDMNRSIMDVCTVTEGRQNQGKILYDYVLGVYRFIERLLERYPNIFIEGCSGGGGRFDAGMLYYTPQIWCSDNTDAIERTVIQHGTSFGYPISTVGSHVSAVPNHQSGRIVDIHTRGVVAMAGSFGYELDLATLADDEKEVVRQQIKDYNKYWDVIQNGKYFRLHTPGKDTETAAWMFVSEDQKKALCNIVTLDFKCNSPVQYVKLKGLEENTRYRLENTNQTGLKTANEDGWLGSSLMHAGIPVLIREREYQSMQLYLVAEK